MTPDTILIAAAIALLSGEGSAPVPPVVPAAPAAAAVPTFSRDIAPILQKRCQECHRPGEVAPMSFLTYADSRPWARSIRKEVSARRMPPWHASPAHGKFQNDARLTDEEVRAFEAWADGGAPEGDPKDLPPPRPFTEGWRMGKPDVVLTMPREFKVKAKGEVPYQFFHVPTGFTEDKWVVAAEARPGNRKVVHHIIVFVNEPGQELPKDQGLGSTIWSRHLCGTAPGQEPDVFPPGTGKKIAAGSTLVFQMHYTPNGTADVDRSSVGLIFAREPVKEEIRVRPIGNVRFRIPPGAASHEVTAKHTFRRGAVVWSLMPHMHLRGKSFRYDAVFPDGRRETILDVPRWDFSWQHVYRFAEPLRLPGETRIECVASFDNSASNEANPDPAREVRWGDQTWDEMMIGFVTYTDPR